MTTASLIFLEWTSNSPKANEIRSLVGMNNRRTRKTKDIPKFSYEDYMVVLIFFQHLLEKGHDKSAEVEWKSRRMGISESMIGERVAPFNWLQAWPLS